MKYIYKCYIKNIDNNIELLHPNNGNKIKIVNFTMKYYSTCSTAKH